MAVIGTSELFSGHTSNDRNWPFSEAQVALFSDCFGENMPPKLHKSASTIDPIRTINHGRSTSLSARFEINRGAILKGSFIFTTYLLYDNYLAEASICGAYS